MSTAVPLHDPLPATPRAVPQARRAVRALLVEQGADDALRDAAELLVTELVTNVVLHVGGTVQVRAVLDDDGLLLEVVDTSPLEPQVRMFSGTATTGRGMRLVRALAAEHGARSEPGGKAVWVLITAASASRDDAELESVFAVDAVAPEQAPRPGGTVALLAA